MTAAQTRYAIRPFRDDDRAALVAIHNADRPQHRHDTAASWERMDARRKPDEVFLRLVVPDPATDRAVAALNASDLNTTGFKMEDVCEFDIVVDSAHRGRGIGGMLYARAARFARERGAKRMVTFFREATPDAPGISFLTKRGFAEQERETPSFLDLTTWDAAPYQNVLDRAAAYGAEIFTLEAIGDTDANRHLYYDLEKPLIYDIPRRDEQPFTFEPYDDWLRFVIERPEWRPDLVLLAAKDGQWIGECHIVPKLESPTVGMQWLTGVLGGHRGHSLATALKVRAYQAARAAGIQVVTTENHEDNGPMLAINRKFGFQSEPAIVSYNKVLDAPEHP
jgi:GNAT superfamily N-acetyltransferase